jgi:hypothetical protein
VVDDRRHVLESEAYVVCRHGDVRVAVPDGSTFAIESIENPYQVEGSVDETDPLFPSSDSPAMNRGRRGTHQVHLGLEGKLGRGEAGLVGAVDHRNG